MSFKKKIRKVSTDNRLLGLMKSLRAYAVFKVNKVYKVENPYLVEDPNKPREDFASRFTNTILYLIVIHVGTVW